MSDLEDIRLSVERFVTAVSNSMRLEVAVFDSDSQLFYCTPTYVKKKGRTVHTPSLREVMENGSVLVNKPGEMASCIGCRFKTHCPSTIEILCCIRADTRIAGVLAFTSFTKEGQKRITENTSVYLNAITELANMIGSLLLSRDGGASPVNLDANLLASMELCNQPMLLTDAHGVILQYNQLAANLFRVCDISTTSLWQLFPHSVVKRIMEGNNLYEKSVSIGDSTTKISTRAIVVDDQVTGFFIRLSDNLYKPSKDTSYFEGIIGSSPAITRVQKVIKRIADSPTPVLITGETGTGKELIARAIHEQSGRNKYPFVAINCSSIPDNLFESELFGYEEGSFTGAKKGGKIGKIELANHGTLFLDEIGELPIHLQVKLLRAIENKMYTPVGSNTPKVSSFRLVAATNQDLSKMVLEKKMRSDFYYRVHVLSITLPPLRERHGDIPLLVEAYMERKGISCALPLQVRLAMEHYDWPGNVRELHNFLDRYTAFGDVALESLGDAGKAELLFPALHHEGLTLETATLQLEERLIRQALERCRWRRGDAAEALGLNLRTLQRKMKRLGMGR